MAEGTSDPTSPTPSQEALSVTGAAELLGRFPEESSSRTKPDPEPVETEEADADLPADTLESEDADAARLEDEPTEPSLETPPLHKVKVDGVVEEVTLEEALKGYSRTADYNKSKRQLADDRRKTEAEVQAARQARDAYAEKLTLVDQALADEPAPDWVKVKEEQPEDFPQLYADWRLRQDEHQKVKAERKRVTDEQVAEAAQRHQVYVDGQEELLREKIPELTDAEKAGKFKGELISYAESQGFQREELARIDDHRAIVVLDKARKYDAIVARKNEPKKQTTPTVTPGARPPSVKGAKAKKAQQEAQDRLSRTGKIDDAVDAIMNMGI